MQSLAELWLTAGGHSLLEHLSGTPLPWRKAVWDRYALSDPRAEALLCGMAYVLPEETRRGAAAAGLEAKHFRNQNARAVWCGESRPVFETYAMDEYGLALGAITEEAVVLHWTGEHTPLHDATPVEVAEALAARIVQLAQARAKLREADALLSGHAERPARRRSGVTL